MPVQPISIGARVDKGSVEKNKLQIHQRGVVLHVVSGTFLGGGQFGALELCQGLRRAGFAETKLCTLGAYNPFFESVDPVPIPEYDGRYNNPWVALRTVRALRGVLREYQPAIMHTHGWDADVLGSLAARGIELNHISHIRSLQHWAESTRLRHRLRAWLTRWTMMGSKARFIAVSKAAKLHACDHLGWATENVTVVENGVDVNRFRMLNRPTYKKGGSETCVLGTACRLDEEKGVDTLLEAVRVAKIQHGCNIEVRIAGTGRLRNSLEMLAGRLNIAEQIHFLGPVANMPDFYRGLDIFILASCTEGMPKVVLEAMSTGLPVIATDVGGTREVITNEADGLLVPARDAWCLASAIDRLVKSPSQCIELGQNARRRIEREASIERVLAEVSRIYHVVLQNWHDEAPRR